MGQFHPLPQRLRLGLLTGGDVQRDTAHEDRFATAVELDVAARDDPT